MANPDLIGAIMAYGRSQSSIATPISTAAGYKPVSDRYPLSARKPRMSGTRQDIWQFPAYAVFIHGPQGGPTLEEPLNRTRVTLECYGPDERTAKDFAETVIAVFAPRWGPSTTFRLANVAVSEITRETDPIWAPDTDANWPRVLVPLLFQWTAAS